MNVAAFDSRNRAHEFTAADGDSVLHLLEVFKSIGVVCQATSMSDYSIRIMGRTTDGKDVDIHVTTSSLASAFILKKWADQAGVSCVVYGRDNLAIADEAIRNSSFYKD